MAHEAVHQILAGRVADARTTLGMTQETLAQAVGISRPGVAQIERGANGCTLPVLCRVAAALGVTTDYLLGMPNSEPIGLRLVKREQQLRQDVRERVLDLLRVLEE